MTKPVFALAIGSVLATSTATALAGDAAARRVIGFSPDGRYFAIEQYGQHLPANRRRLSCWCNASAWALKGATTASSQGLAASLRSRPIAV
ncbi:hypothetical protein FJ546_05100 [Mesorhizobium sp. B2-4-19]|uniref:hypothetical protein n=1 Tax=Mesorhizobium sp. B2-4-19 TaxID=2589930 RepID=UPI001129CE84|nr:hypothetical protein [Mesorhizobium sp. B2-4-19]TPK67903.1 hypothetical protein FJ546_05100 [Mesorhizobium sp. B2-4-19]